MKKIILSIISLIILLTVSFLFYVSWILNKGEFQSKYLEEFINNKFKKEGVFYTSIKDPILKFNKNEKRLVIDGENFKFFNFNDKQLSEFDNLKVYIDLKTLLTKRKLDANRVELESGSINIPNVFSKTLSIKKILLEGNLYPRNDQIYLSKFSTSINDDFYQGSATIYLEEMTVKGVLNQLNRENVFYNMNLVSNEMMFDVDKSGFNIEGKGNLGDINILVKGRKNYQNKKEFISKYNVKATMNEEDIEKNFKFKLDDFLNGPIDMEASYFVYQNGKEEIKTKNNLKNNYISIPFLNLKKEKDVDASAEIDFNFKNKKLNNIKILKYQENNKKLDGQIQFSNQIKPFKEFELNFENENKKIEIKLERNKGKDKLFVKGDYFDFTNILKDFIFEEEKEDNILTQFQPIIITLKSKQILVTENQSIYNVDSIMEYDNKLFKEIKLNSELEDKGKHFILEVTAKDNNQRELKINSNDAGLLLKKFNVNKSGKEGEFVLYGIYNDNKDSHPLNASVTIRDMRLIKAPTLAKILNLASIGIVSVLSGEGILINKLKSEFVVESGILNLNKYEAYGPDIGFSNQGKIFLKEKEIDLEGALVPMVTLNKIIGSIPVLGKILTNERKGIWSFIYTIKGNMNEPTVQVDPLKSITPGFIKKFFSVFKTEKEEEN